MATTSVSLTDHHKRIIEQQIASGRYASTSDVIREGLRLVEDKELKRVEAMAQLERLLEEAQQGGGRHEMTTELFEDIRRRGREKLRKEALAAQRKLDDAA